MTIKSYLKFCSITDTPQWQPDNHNAENRFELIDPIRDTTFGSDTEDSPNKKKVVKVKAAENIAELEAKMAKCCVICHPDFSPESWPKDFQVSKIVKAMSLHMLNFHGIEDTCYKEDKHKHEVLRLLNDNKLKSTYTIEDNDKFKCKLCPYESLEQSQFDSQKREFKGLATERRYKNGLHLKYHIDGVEDDFDTYVRTQIAQNGFKHKCHYRDCDFTYVCEDGWGGKSLFWPHTNELYRRHWDRHRRIINDIGFFSCDYCAETFDSKKKFDLHNAKHDKSLQVQCPECGKMCLSKSKLKTHIDYEHRQVMARECEICHEVCKGQGSFDSHMVRVHGFPRQYKCEYCEAEFVRQSHLSRHLKQFHGPNSDPSKPISIRIRGPNVKPDPRLSKNYTPTVPVGTGLP